MVIEIMKLEKNGLPEYDKFINSLYGVKINNNVIMFLEDEKTNHHIKFDKDTVIIFNSEKVLIMGENINHETINL